MLSMIRMFFLFHVDYIKTMDSDKDIDDEQVWDINREKAFMAPQRISLVTKHMLDLRPENISRR